VIARAHYCETNILVHFDECANQENQQQLQKPLRGEICQYECTGFQLPCRTRERHVSATEHLIREDQEMLTNKLLEAAMCSYKQMYCVVTVTNARSWDVTTCRLVKIYGYLGGKYCVRIQCRRMTVVEGSEEGCSRFLRSVSMFVQNNLTP